MPSLTGFTGCCGADIVYGFDVAPDATAGYVLTDDGRAYKKDENGSMIPKRAEDTFKEQFAKQRAYMPNRLYTCILNMDQYKRNNMAWPKILKEMGFEFVRSWSNSNHDGSIGGKSDAIAPHPLYLFVLCTDDKGKYKDHNLPPPKWDEL